MGMAWVPLQKLLPWGRRDGRGVGLRKLTHCWCVHEIRHHGFNILDYTTDCTYIYNKHG